MVNPELAQNNNVIDERLITTFENHFKLNDPFMIASSHWTSEHKALEYFVMFNPAAVTLKTISQVYGGDGQSISGTRKWAEIVTYEKNELGRFVDGPRNLELWDVATGYEMSDVARDMFKDKTVTNLGLSILQGENYSEISTILDMSRFDYVELNWKYSFRKKKHDEIVTEIRADLELFFSAFSEIQHFIKLPREVTQQYFLELLLPVFELMAEKNAILIVANSKRTTISPSRTTYKKDIFDLESGVLIGDHLFIETYDTIRRLTEFRQNGKAIPEIVATGGIMDICSVIDCIYAGANAVQLCTIFDKKGPFYLKTLREQLLQIINYFKLDSYHNLCIQLRKNDQQSLDIIKYSKDLSLTKAVKDETQSRDILKETLLRQLEFDDDSNDLRKDSDEESIKMLSMLIKKGSKKRGKTIQLSEKRGYKLIVPKSNIASFLLSELCKNRYFLNYQEVEAVDSLRDVFKSKEFTYDFAIITRSELKYLQNDGIRNLKGNYPHEVGVVGKSIVDIVGNKNDKIEEVDTIYHFGGIASRFAITELLKEVKPHLIQISKSEIKDVLPQILSFWKPDEKIAFASGSPLGSFYAYYLTKENKSMWGKIRSYESDLVLVTSESFNQNKDSTGKLKNTFLKIIRALNYEIRENVEFYVDDLVKNGLLPYIAKLIKIN